MNDDLDPECMTCIKGDFPAECPESKRSCGHHCNCTWIHAECHWCGDEFGDIDEELETMIDNETSEAVTLKD